MECCFVDDKDDYSHWNADKCSAAIVSGILNAAVSAGTSNPKTSEKTPKPTTPAAKPTTSTAKIHVVHQVFAKDKGWLPEVIDFNTTNGNGYSGLFGRPLVGFRAKTKGEASIAGYLKYRAHKKGGPWFGWRTDYDKDSSGDTFAGTCKSEIDGLQFYIQGVSGKHVRYRVHTSEDGLSLIHI